MPRAAVVQMSSWCTRFPPDGKESWHEMRDSCLWTPNKPSGWRMQAVASFFDELNDLRRDQLQAQKVRRGRQDQELKRGLGCTFPRDGCANGKVFSWKSSKSCPHLFHNSKRTVGCIFLRETAAPRASRNGPTLTNQRSTRMFARLRVTGWSPQIPISIIGW
jgi:hypothetical protein